MSSSKIFIRFLVSLSVLIVNADEHSHIYSSGEEVVPWMNTIGPYHNRQETYAYFSLPFCKGPKEEISHYHETLGEAILGIELEFSGLGMQFNAPSVKSTFCEITIDAAQLETFIYAVKNHYWYQMYIDDLPIWGIVGEVGEDKKYYIWTHKRFDIGFNEKYIVYVNLTSENKMELKPDITIPFTYEVNWIPSKIEFHQRFNKYLDPSFFQHRIHWFSIFNSFMMVIFLVGLVFMILMRTLRKDYARYSRDEQIDDMERDLGDEYGWKQVHGDVFRSPTSAIFFTSLVGAGSQLILDLLLGILFVICGQLYTERGEMLNVGIIIYAITSPVNGYIGGSLYAKMDGRKWVRQLIISTFLVPGPLCATSFVIKVIAMYYHASRSVTLSVILSVTALCIFIILPLTFIGNVLGRNFSGQPNHPCRVNAVPRPIPEKKWFMELWVIIPLGGILPFGCIFTEMYFIFTSFWAYKIYYVYGLMLLVVLMMLIVVMCVTIVASYFLLNSEDYRWHWTAFASAASTAIYVYCYSVYYYLFKTKMFGLFQTAFYFGYMAVFSCCLGLMCGTAGYFATKIFVNRIYSTVKID